MVDVSNIRLGKNAQFFRILNSIPKSRISSYIDQASEKREGNYLLKEISKNSRISGVPLKYSFAIFKFSQQPTFLDGTVIKEKKFGIIFLVEMNSILAVFKNHAESPEEILSDFIEPIPYREIEYLFADKDPMYEKINLTNMSVSMYSMKQKAYEAVDLKKAMPTIGAGRAIPRGLRLKFGNSTYSVTPNTARVSKRDPKADIHGIFTWVSEITKAINQPKTMDGFLSNFAQPVNLEDLPDDTLPTGILIYFDELDAKLRDAFAAATLKRYSKKSRDYIVVSERLLSKIFHVAAFSFDIEKIDEEYQINYGSGLRLGTIRINRKSITIASPLLDRIFLFDGEEEKTTLKSYLNSEQTFLITYNDPKYVYFSKMVFEDKNLLSNIEGFLRIFVTAPGLQRCTTEKGCFTNSQIGFDADCIFHVVENEIAASDDFLVCDDLGDEWADHIGISLSQNTPCISFYHSKHKEKTRGASSFQDVVCQAQKNLGRLNSDLETFKSKAQAKWSEFYSADNTTTAINRLRRGTSIQAFELAVATAVGNPNSIKKVALAVSFLSKSELEADLVSLKNGNTAKPFVLQVLWLLSAYVSSCREAGSQPYIYCLP